jgi:hypothetical protein
MDRTIRDVETGAAHVAELLVQPAEVGLRKRRRRDRAHVGPQVLDAAGAEECDAAARLMAGEPVGSIEERRRATIVNEEPERLTARRPPTALHQRWRAPRALPVSARPSKMLRTTNIKSRRIASWAIAIESVSVRPRVAPIRLLPAQPSPATLTHNPVRPSVVYSIGHAAAR